METNEMIVIRAPTDGSIVEQNVRKDDQISLRDPEDSGDMAVNQLAFTMRVTLDASDWVIHDSQLKQRREWMRLKRKREERERKRQVAEEQARVRAQTRHGQGQSGAGEGSR